MSVFSLTVIVGGNFGGVRSTTSKIILSNGIISTRTLSALREYHIDQRLLEYLQLFSSAHCVKPLGSFVWSTLTLASKEPVKGNRLALYFLERLTDDRFHLKILDHQ